MVFRSSVGDFDKQHGGLILVPFIILCFVVINLISACRWYVRSQEKDAHLARKHWLRRRRVQQKARPPIVRVASPRSRPFHQQPRNNLAVTKLQLLSPQTSPQYHRFLILFPRWHRRTMPQSPLQELSYLLLGRTMFCSPSFRTMLRLLLGLFKSAMQLRWLVRRS